MMNLKLKQIDVTINQIFALDEKTNEFERRVTEHLNSSKNMINSIIHTFKNSKFAENVDSSPNALKNHIRVFKEALSKLITSIHGSRKPILDLVVTLVESFKQILMILQNSNPETKQIAINLSDGVSNFLYGIRIELQREHAHDLLNSASLLISKSIEELGKKIEPSSNKSSLQYIETSQQLNSFFTNMVKRRNLLLEMKKKKFKRIHFCFCNSTN